MPRMSKIRFTLTWAAALLLTLSCASEVREANINQSKYIDDYIQANFPDNEVINYNGPVRVVLVDTLGTVPAIEVGDSAFVYYEGYIFEQKGPSSCFVSDKAYVCIGKGDLIQGLDKAMVGAKLGQENLILFPSQYGYGTHGVGLVPENTALMFAIVATQIKKNK